MRVGIIGIGNICQKAYLPVITAIENIELVLCTRNKEILDEVSRKHRINEFVSNVDELIEANVECAFVHSATESHFEIVKKLLENKVNVYVDKPLSYNYDESKELIELSKKTGKILMVGFNRRFAPMYKELKITGEPNIIIGQKNRMGSPNDIRVFIYDDFIHILDTLRFLMGKDYSTLEVKCLMRDEKLVNIVVQLSNNTTTAIGIMNRDSGMNEEVIEYMSSGSKIVVKDLVNCSLLVNGEEKIKKFNDWDIMLYRRGFEGIINEFLNAVKNDKEPSILIEDALVTHKLCEDIINELTKNNK